MIFALDENIVFPDPELSEEDGLLAVGGDLSTERLLLAYRSGIFPWFSGNEPICWYSPDPRCVIFPGEVIISSSMKKIITKNIFEIRTNTAFKKVIEKCSSVKRKDQHGTWITDSMQKAYVTLHESGFAHSVEVWQEGELVGGLYGLIINNVFCGESMFSKVSNASKAALITLCQSGKFKLIDCQVPNDHLLRMGAVLIERKDYLAILRNNSNK